MHTDPAARPVAPDVEALQDALTDAIRTWDDRFLSQPTCDTTIAAQLGGVPEAYKADVDPAHAVEDLRRIAALDGPGAIDVRLYPGPTPAERRFTLYLAGAPATLTAVLPLLQHLGVDVLDERPSEFQRADGLRCWLYDFGLRLDDPTHAALAELAGDDVEAGFSAAFCAAWRGDIESDRFNALVLRAGLPWREVAVLRAYARYTRQVGRAYGLQYIADTLLAHPNAARALMALFHARFDPAVPDADRDGAVEEALSTCTALVDAVTGLDADRILRGYLASVTATLRTNWFRGRPFFSFKMDPRAVPQMPAPRPQFEIFVYSPRMEGVHLRFGQVARGGLRWSDRPQDYRTEILGLVKAQMVKNAVIVPVGAKGGFVVRAAEPGPRRGARPCYRIFISGAARPHRQPASTAATVPPPDVVRHDGDDSYLVVAADKGTARFSDVANDVAASYGFWLGDAFASGGSVGYDHKAMGITARGAWESVKRHFRELGVDTQTEDVHRRRDRRHVRRRLRQRHAALPAHPAARRVRPPARLRRPRPRPGPLVRRARAAVRAAALDAGTTTTAPRSARAGACGRGPRNRSRSARRSARRSASARTSPAVPARARSGRSCAPRPTCCGTAGSAPTSRRRTESNADAGDKANDAVRADGHELRVKVVGEGGNLGLTQRGRIEFARARREDQHRRDRQLRRCRLLRPRGQHQDPAGPAGPQRATSTAPARDALLAEMTDEVADLVLADNRGPERGARHRPRARAGDAERARPAHRPTSPPATGSTGAWRCSPTPRPSPRSRPPAGA